MSGTLVELFVLSVPVLIVGIIMGVTALSIYLDYKKKIVMIEKGLVHEDEKCEKLCRPDNRLGWGIIVLGLGISLIIGKIFNLDYKIVAGLILLSIGTSLLVSYLIYRNLHKEDK